MLTVRMAYLDDRTGEEERLLEPTDQHPHPRGGAKAAHTCRFSLFALLFSLFSVLHENLALWGKPQSEL